MKNYILEKLLIGLGIKCGTVKNFNTAILEAARQNKLQSWYFLTPIKNKDNGSGYMEATINFAYPILSNIQDIDGNGGLVSPLKIEITSSRDSDGVTLSQYATLKATWAPSPYATTYDVECNIGEVEGEETLVTSLATGLL